MTALFMDGFDHYGTGPSSTLQMGDGPYSSVQSAECNVPVWGPARTGVACLSSSGIANATTDRVLPAAETNLFVSFGWACNILGGEAPAMIAFKDTDGTIQCYLQPTATGAVNLYQGNGDIIAGTSGPAIVTQNWHFLEMNLNTSSGTFTLRIDDAGADNTPILSITNEVLSGFSIGLICLIHAFNNTAALGAYVDDLFVRNGSGTTNNSWLGDRRVATLFPFVDTATNAWEPSYYQLFGTGIYRGAYAAASNNEIQNNTANIAVQAAASLDIGAADFTLETMIRWDALPAAGAYSSIFSRWDAPDHLQSYRFFLGGSSLNGGCLQFDTSTDGTASTQETMIQYPWTPETDVWYHLALCRTAGEILLFVDGVQLGLPVTDSRTYFGGGVEYLAIGQEFGSHGIVVQPNTWMAARLDESRFTNGVGRYSATFTPPNAPFPRGSGDPHWADVVLLMGYDSAIIDESSFAQTVSSGAGAIAFQPSDGASLGSYTTVNKPIPDDNTFIEANFTNASNVFTMTSQPTAGNTVTVGTTDGTTPAVYTFRSALVSAFDILIDTSAQNTLNNLLNAINAGTGAGTKYGTGTTSNFDVNATPLPPGQFYVTANIAGTVGNAIASTATGSAAVWTTATLTGGLNIPGPTNFKVQRPPNNTTIISAAQMITRALKTDAGTASIDVSLIGALGGTQTSGTFNLTTSPTYYNLIIEEDPDTSGPVTPTTLVNGQIQINRTA